jgi:uncharacterized protein (DUF849 family)
VEEKMEKVIVTVALVGSHTTREKNPNVPMTPKELAESAIESYRAGAAVCHVHVRDPETHKASFKLELYQEVFERIRGECDMIVNLTTGRGAGLLFNPGAKDHPWDTSLLKNPEERVEHVVKLKPEVCSLDLGTLNFGTNAQVNVIPIVEKMAIMIKEVGTKPELEVFDIGNIRIANYLISKGLVERPPLFQLCLGIPWGIEATIENLVYMRNNLPRDALWYAFSTGSNHFTMAAASMIMGGHVRVGFEDNIYIKKDTLATSNAQMVSKVVEIAKLMDREVASAKEARQILKLVK